MTRSKEAFTPINEGVVKIYTCGPTVYGVPHIGNMRAFTFEDLFRRFLIYTGYKVIQVMNITDIDDKIIKGSIKNKILFKEYTLPYIEEFFRNLELLNIQKAEHYPKATEHIEEMINIIKILLKKDIAYKSDDGSIYYNISKFPNYGKLAHLDLSTLIGGARVCQDEYDKDCISDFALWKNYDEKDGDAFWETELGKGRPGWHIECSAMSTKYLGKTFDIHTGAVDNIFPHHENEIAQSEGAFGVKFVNYWMHNEHLLVNNQKMSKSLGNFYTIPDVIKMGCEPMALRYLYISSHYRSKINFTEQSIKGAQNTIDNLRDFIIRMENQADCNINTDGEPNKISELINKTRCDFISFMNDDLNSPRAFSSIFDSIKIINILNSDGKLLCDEAKDFLNFILEIDDAIFGLNLSTKQLSGIAPNTLSDEQKRLIKDREQARASKNWKLSDEIRDILLKDRILLEDTKDGTRWKIE